MEVGIFSNYDVSDQLMSEIPIAANINSGTNPSYTLAGNFLADFPQFNVACTGASPSIPATLSQKFIDMANSSVSYSKYGEIWSYCMGLYVAHFCTMYLFAANGVDSTQGIVGHAKPVMLQTSKAVGDVSAGYDVNSIADDLKGFGSFKMTTYGQQFATFAKMAGIGGAYVR